MRRLESELQSTCNHGNYDEGSVFAKYADLFYDEKEVLEDLVEDTIAQVRSRCKRVLKGLGVEATTMSMMKLETEKGGGKSPNSRLWSQIY